MRNLFLIPEFARHDLRNTRRHPRRKDNGRRRSALSAWREGAPRCGSHRTTELFDPEHIEIPDVFR
jgi:hypothetical protein